MEWKLIRRQFSEFIFWFLPGPASLKELVVFQKLTHIIYAFGVAKDDGTFALADEYAAYDKGGLKDLKDVKNGIPGLQIGISVGGWDHRNQLGYIDVELFVNGLCGFVERHGFDFVDVDWEFDNGDHAANSRYRLHCFIKSLKRCLKGKYITMALQCNAQICDCLDLGGVKDCIHWFTLMGYNFSGTWSPVAAPHSALYPTIHTMINYLQVNGISQLVLAVSSFGVKFSNCMNFAASFDCATDIGLGSVKELESIYDASSCSGFIIKGNSLISIESPLSLEVKLKYINEKNLVGLAIWDIFEFHL